MAPLDEGVFGTEYPAVDLVRRSRQSAFVGNIGLSCRSPPARRGRRPAKLTLTSSKGDVISGIAFSQLIQGSIAACLPSVRARILNELANRASEGPSV